MTATPSATCTDTISGTLARCHVHSPTEARVDSGDPWCSRIRVIAPAGDEPEQALRDSSPAPVACDTLVATADAATIGAMIEEGKPAPDFTLPSDSGEAVTLSALSGRPVVLYFYPKDDTPGCTTQACALRDVWSELQQTGATVLGVSPDSPKSHVKFREKYALPFSLLSDEDHSVAEAYGVWVEKSMYGKRYMGVERSTFVIDADGVLSKVMRRVDPTTHAEDVLAAL
jgi:peroxiredoxin Q/BCP